MTYISDDPNNDSRQYLSSLKELFYKKIEWKKCRDEVKLINTTFKGMCKLILVVHFIIKTITKIITLLNTLILLILIVNNSNLFKIQILWI